VERVVYRIVADVQPTADDFRSNRDKGFPPRGAEIDDPALWSGWSVFDRRDEAESRARRYGLGAYLAVMRIPDAWTSDPSRFRKTLGPHHYTVWGTFTEVRSFIQAVIEIPK